MRGQLILIFCLHRSPHEARPCGHDRELDPADDCWRGQDRLGTQDGDDGALCGAPGEGAEVRGGFHVDLLPPILPLVLVAAAAEAECLGASFARCDRKRPPWGVLLAARARATLLRRRRAGRGRQGTRRSDLAPSGSECDAGPAREGRWDRPPAARPRRRALGAAALQHQGQDAHGANPEAGSAQGRRERLLPGNSTCERVRGNPLPAPPRTHKRNAPRPPLVSFFSPSLGVGTDLPRRPLTLLLSWLGLAARFRLLGGCARSWRSWWGWSA